jgi:hypothetical protein
MLVLFAQKAYVQTGKVSTGGLSTEAPIYFSQWGPLKSGSHTAVQVGAIAPAAIVVKDQMGTLYSVVSFRINYKFKSTYKDGETEEMKSIWDLRVSDFNQTAQLSKPWVESIKDNIKAGDTILINKIIFKNTSGKTKLAPDLKIAVR